MWFKNMNVYRLTAPWTLPTAQLSECLRSQAFQPCGSMDMQSTGWSVVREADGELVHAYDGQILLKLTTETKLMPASAIAIIVKERVKDIEEQQGFKPGRKQLREIKETITDELLPKALVTRRHVGVWIDTKNGWLVVDSATPARADDVFKLLIKSLDDLPFCAMRTVSSPISAMTTWLSADEAPAGFTVDQDAVLRASGESKATVRYAKHTLEVEDVRRHIAAGKQCTQLALTWSDKVSFVLTEALTFKRVAPLDIIAETAHAMEEEHDRFNADFILMAGELNLLLQEMVVALGGFDAGKADLVDSVSQALDDTYQQAVGIVREAGKVSISHLQCVMRIGYNQAARLIEEMERQGVVSADGGNGRKLLEARP